MKNCRYCGKESTTLWHLSCAKSKFIKIENLPLLYCGDKKVKKIPKYVLDLYNAARLRLYADKIVYRVTQLKQKVADTKKEKKIFSLLLHKEFPKDLRLVENIIFYSHLNTLSFGYITDSNVGTDITLELRDKVFEFFIKYPHNFKVTVKCGRCLYTLEEYINAKSQ
jgi:hypothetical protein